MTWESPMEPQLLGRLPPGRLNVEVVYQCPDLVCRCGQDHGVRSFPSKFQSLVVSCLNPDSIT